MLEKESNLETMSRCKKDRLIDGFLDVIANYHIVDVSYATFSLKFDNVLIDGIPEDIVKEYKEVRLCFEDDIKKLIKRIEELPTDPL